MTSPDLAAHYTRLWETTKQKIQETGGYELDPLIDAPDDLRRGITLVIRPSQEVKVRMQSFLQELRALEPEQYYYPASDLHVTVLSIISCYPGFRLEDIVLSDYVARVRQALVGIRPFAIHYQGITASPSCVLAQGFPQDDMLGRLRDQLRTAFKSSGLQQSIDARYTLQTAHSTVLRFRMPLRQPAAFLEKLESLREHDFGLSPITGAELVFNDWYQREQDVQVLARFPFEGP